ncbi:hypothetical protein CEXT_420221 [Caerostris extrusa]|uniref:Uncharacterized protein n=1 Tax=Caerostris extrusa TaxID=172846 RepID=A0AAV4TI20_CAEEX|nr:hypothetical protein CEXT_420221 [Caerostris extrusa]
MPMLNLLFKSREQQKADPAAQKLCATSICNVRMWQPSKCNGQASSRESLLLDRGVLPAPNNKECEFAAIIMSWRIRATGTILTLTWFLQKQKNRDQQGRKSRLSKTDALSTRNVRMFQPSALRSAMDRPTNRENLLS